MTSGLVMRGTCNQTDDLMRGLMTRISPSLHQPVVTPYSSQVPCRSGLKRLYCKLIRIKAKHHFLSRGQDFGAACVQRVAQERATFSTGEEQFAGSCTRHMCEVLSTATNPARSHESLQRHLALHTAAGAYRLGDFRAAEKVVSDFG